MSDQPTQPTPPEQAATFQIEKIYVKDLSLEIPHAPRVFLEQAQPNLEVRLDTAAGQFADGYYEVTVTATVTAKVGERTLFLVEAVQAGIFAVRGVPPEELPALLGIACPSAVFPYLRETVSETIVRAGFPSVLIAPLSFEALYAQRMQEQGQGGPRIEVAR
jgi:preprotein translocase subunit SecB